MPTSQVSGDGGTTLGRNLTAARKAKGLKQRHVSQALNVDVMMVSKWERGVHRPTHENLLRLADLYGRDLGWFVTEHGAKQRAA